MDDAVRQRLIDGLTGPQSWSGKPSEAVEQFRRRVADLLGVPVERVEVQINGSEWKATFAEMPTERVVIDITAVPVATE